MINEKFQTSKNDHWAVLLLAHGAPDRLEDIPEFLLHVRSGRKLPEAAIQEITHRYAQIGGGSPLLKLTQSQAAALARAIGRPVYIGMRNWRPFIADSIRQLSDDGVGRVVALCLAPQNSRTSIGLYRKHLLEAVEKCAPGLRVEFIDNWHNHPSLVAAFREKVMTALEQAEAEAGELLPVVFTAHSVPTRTIAEGDPYEAQVRETARMVAESIGPAKLNEWRVAFQSQGMTEEPWIGPTVESQIDLLAERGCKHVVLAPIGFVSDHVEILYDVDIVFKQYSQSKGIKVWRSESLNDSPLLIQALASIVSSRVTTQRGQAPESSGKRP